MLKNLTPDQPLVLVGCGNMGSALASGWLSAGLPPAALHIVDPAIAGTEAPFEGAQFHAGLGDIDPSLEPAAVVVAVKPQVVPDILPALERLIDSGALVVSIAAGTRIDIFRRALGDAASVIRAMPNTPAAIGKGITALCAGPGVSGDEKELARVLFSCVGEVVWLQREKDVDIVTAVSGSGPAYFFLLAEELAHAATELGLDVESANRLAAATLVGAGALLSESGEDPSTLRHKVTSPKGTTEAALAQLFADSGFSEIIARAVRAATQRSEELSR